MTGEETASVPSMDTVLAILANQYRRRLLVALLDHNPQDDGDPQVPDDVSLETEDLEQLLLSMRHTHLPKLEETGFIEWDRETNMIRKGTQFEEIRPLLELMATHADELPDGWV